MSNLSIKKQFQIILGCMAALSLILSVVSYTALDRLLLKMPPPMPEIPPRNSTGRCITCSSVLILFLIRFFSTGTLKGFCIPPILQNPRNM